MATYTENYGLHQWESGDSFIRTDFNEDLLKIDTALGAVEDAVTEGIAVKCEVVIGHYVGDNSESREIVLGFKPKLVLLEAQHALRGTSSNAITYGGMITEDCPLYNADYDRTGGTITDNGFQVYYEYIGGIYTNRSSYNYTYIAFK